jgi:hypothetical protein
MHRHSLCSVLSPSAHDSCCRFPRVDARAHRVCINGRHRVRTTASRLWLCISPQRWLYFKSAVRDLSYPEPPGFPRWRTVQASPRVPAALLRPHQPTSAEPVLLLPCSPGASPSRCASGRRFHFMTGRHTIFLCVAVSWSPSTPAMPDVFDGVEGVITDPSARCDVASPIRGTTLRQRLDPRGSVNLSVWRTDVPFRACVFGSWRTAPCGFVCRRNRMRQPAEPACSRAGLRAITDVLR